jgi:hypothetical protein
VLLNLVVLAAFGIAVYTMYTLIQNSGVLGSTEEEGVVNAMFTDVPTTDPHVAELQEAAILGLVETSTPTVFGVEESVTRGDLSETVVKTLGLKVPRDGVHAFADVPGDPEVLDTSDYVALAVELGYMSGIGGDPPLFDADADSTVGEVLLVFARAGGDALVESSPTATTAASEATAASTTATTAEPAPEGAADAATTEAAAPLDAQSAHARLEAAGILEGLEVASTETALELQARRKFVALVAVRMRHFLDSL